jgi:hypothetical protein
MRIVWRWFRAFVVHVRRFKLRVLLHDRQIRTPGRAGPDQETYVQAMGIGRSGRSNPLPSGLDTRGRRSV